MHRSRNRGSAAKVEIEAIADRLSGPSRSGNPDYERDFAGLLTLLSPQISGLVRQYRLEDMREDAEQAAAIGVHRALASYDPEKASFGTHASWQIRGELQSLRYRARLDQRRSARVAGMRTVSFEEIRARVNGRHEESVFEVIDDTALDRAERGASDSMTRALAERLMAKLEAPSHERAIVLDHVFDRSAIKSDASPRTPEQRRQIVRRTMRNCAKVLAA